eukprot:TRINITY_DN2237_c0_g1_i3.p1 TRINITY_DN2237_c0_g1~~TRINITY_DN2237_c0_g1_i3.p1  ORF type:complete len:110 (+),score=16.42 TRINITY_DN2237_c0_g1_i3:113-442(+)
MSRVPEPGSAFPPKPPAQSLTSTDDPTPLHERTPVLNQLQIRVESEKFLRETPELKIMLDQFLLEVLNQRPDNVIEFACEHFQHTDDIRSKIGEYDPTAFADIQKVFSF